VSAYREAELAVFVNQLVDICLTVNVG